jgi:hypothetical protein
MECNVCVRACVRVRACMHACMYVCKQPTYPSDCKAAARISVAWDINLGKQAIT